jgi:hypothetical protein
MQSQDDGFSKKGLDLFFDFIFQGGKCTEIFFIFAPSKNILALWALSRELMK